MARARADAHLDLQLEHHHRGRAALGGCDSLRAPVRVTRSCHVWFGTTAASWRSASVSPSSCAICSKLLPAVLIPRKATASEPISRTAVVMLKTQPNPILWYVYPMTIGANIPPMRPKADATPMPVVRILVGESSGV